MRSTTRTVTGAALLALLAMVALAPAAQARHQEAVVVPPGQQVVRHYPGLPENDPGAPVVLTASPNHRERPSSCTAATPWCDVIPLSVPPAKGAPAVLDVWLSWHTPGQLYFYVYDATRPNDEPVTEGAYRSAHTEHRRFIALSGSYDVVLVSASDSQAPYTFTFLSTAQPRARGNGTSSLAQQGTELDQVGTGLVSKPGRETANKAAAPRTSARVDLGFPMAVGSQPKEIAAVVPITTNAAPGLGLPLSAVAVSVVPVLLLVGALVAARRRPEAGADQPLR